MIQKGVEWGMKKRARIEIGGKSLTEYRARAGYTLQEAAKALGTSVSYLSELENGVKKNPSDEVLIKIAELYKVPENLLLEKFGRMDVAFLEELEKNDSLKHLLTEIRYSSIIETEEEKREVIDKVLDYFKNLMTEMEEKKEEKRGRKTSYERPQ